MGDQRIPFAHYEQEHRTLLFAGRARATRAGHPSDDPESARRCRDGPDAFLQASEMNMYPEEFRYTKEHEWVKPEGDIGRRSEERRVGKECRSRWAGHAE